MKKNGMIIIGTSIALILSVLVIYVTFAEDTKGPVITVDTSEVKPYAADQGTDTLKKYVKAIDKVDGDVGDTLIVENVYILSDMHTAKVAYVARDKKNNVTKYNYLIEYLPTDEEVLEKSKESQNQTNQEETKASNEKETAAETMTAETTTAQQDTTQAGAPELTLTANEATMKKGSTFSVSQYISEIKDSKDSKTTLSKRVVVSGNYSTTKPGDYELDIYCTNTRQIESNHTKFILHITK